MQKPDLFFVQINGVSEGPLSRSEIERLHSANLINRYSPCRKATSQQWLTVWDLVPSAMQASRRDDEIPKLRQHALRVPSSLYGLANKDTLRKRIGVFVGIIAVLILGWALMVVFWDSPSTVDSNNPTSSLSAGSGRIGSGDRLTGSGRGLAQLSASQNQLAGQINAMIAGSMLFALLVILLSLVFLVFWIWMIIAVATLEPPTHDKTTWTIIVVFLGPLGATIYFFARYVRLTRV